MSELRVPTIELLARVRALFDADAAPELHGRLVVIGLFLLDADVGSSFERSGLLDAVMAELSEPIDSLLTPAGREQRDRRLGVGASADASPDDGFTFLTPSAKNALAYADGLRVALGQPEVHMEHLLVGLYQKAAGPMQRLLRKNDVDQAAFEEAVWQAVETSLPSNVVPTALTALPPLSRHAARAVDNAFALAGSSGRAAVRSRHLLVGALSVEDCSVVEALADRGVLAVDVDDLHEPPPDRVAGVVRPRLRAGAAADTVPTPGNGRVREADRLGTINEVEMLVSVLLDESTPLPVAVGLFGDWGSGKSFFMALMQERIDELTKLAREGKPEAAPFCREVRQVRFNAWHYVDTNLWASLAATLFDELAQADKPDEAKTKLSEVDVARALAEEARSKRERLEREAAELAAQIERPAAVLRPSAAVAVRAVRDDPKLREHLRHAAKNGAAVDDQTDRLVTALGDVHGAAKKAGMAWRLFQEELLYRRRKLTTVTLLVLFAIAAGVSVLVGWPAVGKVATLVSAVAVALVPALDGTVRVLYLAREAREARELPLVDKEDELARARAEEATANRAVEEREKELDTLRNKGQRLQEFVRERAVSSDYRQELGTISRVRRDFEQLVALMPDSDQAPAGPAKGAEQVVAVAKAVAEQVPEVERIFLYIDDLDRCPHRKVVEVLQAVHLLLAFKLFVVVVGVDSRWLQRSLQAHYRNLLEEPEAYLEKIFQVPFTLRRMTPTVYEDLIAELANPVRTRHDKRPPETADGAATTGGAEPPTSSTPAPPTARSTSASDSTDAGPARGVTDAVQVVDRSEPISQSVVPEPPPLPRPEALVISDDERKRLSHLGKIVSTPRATKRLVNIYRMLRVSVTDDEIEAFLPGHGDEYQAVVLLLGIVVGRPDQAESVFKAIIASPDDGDVWEVLGRFKTVHEQLVPLREHISLSGLRPYRRWAPRVSRFSFRLAAVLPAEETVLPKDDEERGVASASRPSPTPAPRHVPV